jgi:hypothetical protein
MTRKAAQLPNIEDATLKQCLAPLVDALAGGPELEPWVEARGAEKASRMPRSMHAAAPRAAPIPDAPNRRRRGFVRAPETLAEWRAKADEEFATFGTVERLLERTDAELLEAALAFPRQIGAMIERIAGIEGRLARQHDAVAALLVRLDHALARTAVGA